MATNYQIKTEFSLEDKATKSLESLKTRGNAATRVINAGILKAEERWNALGAAAKNAAIGLAAAGTAALGAGMVAATQKFVAFDDALASAGAHFGNLDVSADDYTEHLNALKESALAVAGATRFNATDSVGALDKMAMAGFTDAQAMAMLAGTASMAASAGVDLTSGVDMVTDAMGAFGLTKDNFGNALDTAGLENNLNRLGDVVTLATKKANFDINMWFESVKNGAPVFTNFGGTLEDFTAIAGTLANVGIKGADAGVAIRNVMQRLAAPTSTAAKAMADMGISIYDSAGKMLPVLDILKQFEDSIGDKSGAEEYLKALEKVGGDASKLNMADFASGGFDKNAIQNLNTIFGQRAISSFLVLLNEGSESIGKFSKELSGAAGAAEKTAGAMNQSLGGRIAILQSALETLGIRFVDSLKTDISSVIDSLTDVIGNFTENTLPTIIQAIQNAIPYIQNIIITVINNLPKLLETLSHLAPLFTIVAGAASLVFSVLWALRNPLVTLLGLWGLYQGAMMALVPILKAYHAVQAAINIVKGFATGLEVGHAQAVMGTTTAISGNTAAINAQRVGTFLYTAATKIATGAQWLWNTAILACPVAWITAAIVAAAALIAGVILIITGKWESLTNTVDGFFAKIREMDGIGGWILGVLVAPLEMLWNLVRPLFDVINAFKVGGFLAGIKMIGLSILQFLVSPIENLLQLLSFIPGLGKLNDKIHGWFDAQRSGILGAAETKGKENGQINSPESVYTMKMPNNLFSAGSAAQNQAIAMQAPTQTQAAASTYSREENFSTSNVNISLENGLKANAYGSVAPGVTVQRTASGAF